MRLVRRIIEEVNLDVRRNPACDGLILVWRDCPAEREHEAETSVVRAVLVRAVDKILFSGEHAADVVREIIRRFVHVERYHLTPCDAFRLAPAILQRAADKAADVLDAVLPRLAHALELGKRFARLGRVRELFLQLVPRHLRVLPVLVKAGLADGDCQLHGGIALRFRLHSLTPS